MLRHLANFLGNRFVGRYHLPLVGLAGICLALLSGLIALGRESLLDFLEVIEQVTNALWMVFDLARTGPARSLGTHEGYALLGRSRQWGPTFLVTGVARLLW